MDKDTRNAIERATQRSRKILEEDFAEQLEGTYDVLRSGSVASKGGAHLTERQHLLRAKIVAAIEHKCAAGMNKPGEAVMDYIRDAAFTALNRFVALKMLEARDLVQECITRGDQSSGYREFCGLAPGIALLPDNAGYRLYIESLFDELSTEMKVLFDRRDPASVLWPRRKTFETLLALLNAPELAQVWGGDETIGWVYQFFNSKEERQAMRDSKQGGSQAPRNGRELAVRNQFFTPRYVVQFLTDNTLGRLWIEMYGPATRLAHVCEFFVRAANENDLVRPKKDPRDLRILDPACGPAHFLLYSFDLLLVVYEEAWEDEAFTARSEATGRTLREDYPDITALRRGAPGLIVKHNLYGVDIDPRCAQIAALALWLRAQRAWKDLGVPAVQRPPIRLTHIVVAEPMPGDAALVEEFATRLEPPLLRDLFKKMVGEMRLAGELGTLLRVEDGIATGLRDARDQFVKQRQTTGFLSGMEPLRKQGELDLSGIDDDNFFHKAEHLIDKALRSFAETATGGASVRRRLFADDATYGIALIDLLRTRFDVVLMNPPFGAGSLPAKKEFEKSYPRTRNDVYAAFVERGVQLLHPHGLLGAITSRTGFFLSSFQKWREEILLKEAPPVVLADLGYGVLDSAMVEVAAYCLEKGTGAGGVKTVFLRALDADDKTAAVRAAIREPEAVNKQRFEVDTASFAAIPRSPFAYWVSESMRRLFKDLPAFEAGERLARQGGVNGDDFRWLRLWMEGTTAGRGGQFVPIAKGGKFSPFYVDLLLQAWWDPLRNTFWAFTGLPHRPSLKPASFDFYFRAGITWPSRPHKRGAFSHVPRGCIFSHTGTMIFCAPDEHWALCALLNSDAYIGLLHILMPRGGAESGQTLKYEVGYVTSVPIPKLTENSRSTLTKLARRAWSLKRKLDTRTETSHAFIWPALLQVPGDTLAARAEAWAEYVRAIESELAAIQAEIDAGCFDIYGINEVDRRTITSSLVGQSSKSDESVAANSEDEGEAEDEDIDESTADATGLAAELVSWAVGVAFGRFDLQLATGVRPMPTEPTPFDPLPVCSPAMLIGNDGLPLASAPVDYSLAFPESGILVDDPGHPHDLTAAVRIVFDEVFGASADARWSETAALFGPIDHDMRGWLASHFFEYHLGRYSKSRRKAPIFWQLGMPSGRYSVWLYAHRVTHDSFFQIQNDVIAPKLAHEERKLTSLVQGTAPSAKERKEIVAQEALVEDLRAMLDEVKRAAPLWNPNLDDGVILTMAPLWRLVPQHKLWQKELKSKWDELAAGKYDWAHLSMHLWPERVIPKCATDRSLAIAHGLEEVFWVKGADGKWELRSQPTRPMDELVKERTSPAVKAALRSLLGAGTQNGGTRGRGKKKATVTVPGGDD